MKVKSIGHSAEFLKRKAKSLSKASGIAHTAALNMVAKDNGYESWDNFIKNQKVGPHTKAVLRRPKVPNPATLNYRDTRMGAILGQHPNKKMSVRRHAKVGSLLQELLNAVEYHKRAKSAIQDIRITMDTWLGLEYNEAELANTEFNQIYYGQRRFLSGGRPSQKQQAELKRRLRQVKAILDRSYHDCKPLERLYQRFELAAKALEKWSKIIKAPGLSRFKNQLPAGTFIRIDHNKKIGVVFHHDTWQQVITGYTDGGQFHAGRHEVTVLRKQLEIRNFKPMRLYLPYGKWTCADGREVLFNRDYCPIWERSTTGIGMAIAPDADVRYTHSEHYYDDRSAPYYGNDETLKNCLAVLKEWGVDEKAPEVLALLPKALAAGDVQLISPRGAS
jgi:hypothetical protein